MDNQLIILGSGNASSSCYKPFDYRHPSGYLLRYEGKNILIEASEGIRGRLEQIKFDWFDIDTILISHFHPDHFVLETLISAVFVRAHATKKDKKIIIFGPKNIRDVFVDIWDKKHFNNSYQQKLSKTITLDFFEFKNGKEIRLAEKIYFVPYNVFHQQGLMDCYALRFMLENKVLSYSGDCGVCDGIKSAANQADVFLCEASTNIGEDTSKTIGHLNPYQAGQIAKEACVNHLILTHYGDKDPPSQMINEAKRAGFKNKVSIASDFQIVPL